MPAHIFSGLVAYYLDGLTERETAERLGLTRHQVRTRHLGRWQSYASRADACCDASAPLGLGFVDAL